MLENPPPFAAQNAAFSLDTILAGREYIPLCADEEASFSPVQNLNMIYIYHKYCQGQIVKTTFASQSVESLSLNSSAEILPHTPLFIGFIHLQA